MAAGQAVINYPVPATTALTNTAAVSTGVTHTIPAAAAGLFNYLVFLEITLFVSTSVTGAAGGVVVTTTGITGTPSFSIGNRTSAVVGDLLDRYVLNFTGNPLKGSAAATAMVITCPIVTGAIWRVNSFVYVDV